MSTAPKTAFIIAYDLQRSTNPQELSTFSEPKATAYTTIFYDQRPEKHCKCLEIYFV